MPRIPAAERRVALIEAGLRVVAREGLAAASTRAIVAEAGMSLASFHYAFESRDAFVDRSVGVAHPRQLGDAVPRQQLLEPRFEREVVFEGDAAHRLPLGFEPRGRVPHRRDEEHDLVPVVRQLREAGRRLDEEELLDAIVGVGGVLRELLGGEDQRGPHARRLCAAAFARHPLEQ